MKVYYTLNSNEMGEEAKKEKLVDIYKEWVRIKEDDKKTGADFTYYFVKHEVKEDGIKNGIKCSTDYETEGKVYKRGDKVFFKEV